MGTKEFKDICICNEYGRVAGFVVELADDGRWWIYNNEYEWSTTKLDVILDWLVDIEILDETRFRLTSAQKSIIRTKIWEWIGCGIGFLIIEAMLVWMMLKLFIG